MFGLGLLLALVLAATNDPQHSPLAGPPSNLDAKAESLMPSKPTNAPSVSTVPTNTGPIQLESLKTPPPAATFEYAFTNGVAMGVLVGRRNLDVTDMDALIEYAKLHWNSRQQRRLSE